MGWICLLNRYLRCRIAYTFNLHIKTFDVYANHIHVWSLMTLKYGLSASNPCHGDVNIRAECHYGNNPIDPNRIILSFGNAFSGWSTGYNVYNIARGDSMIWIFHAPQLTGEQGLCHIVYVISIVDYPEKYRKIVKSWNRKIRPTIRVLSFDL